MKQNRQPIDIEVPIKIDWIHLAYEMCWVIWWPIELNSQQNDFIRPIGVERICDVMEGTEYFVSL